jgi:site-specific DNA-methyltransferase (adenine-specific)
MKAHDRAVIFSSARGTWRTPVEIYRRFVPPAFDSSDTHDGTFDALRDPWPTPWYCNPPYGRGIGKWTAHMIGLGVALLPARTDTVWFQRDVLGRAVEVEFLKGRLHFDGAKGAAPFPSCLVYFEGSFSP